MYSIKYATATDVGTAIIKPKMETTRVPTNMGMIWNVSGDDVASHVEPVMKAKPCSENVFQDLILKKINTAKTSDIVKYAAAVEIAKNARSPLATWRVFIGVRLISKLTPKD
jgi:hypothetical protein